MEEGEDEEECEEEEERRRRKRGVNFGWSVAFLQSLRPTQVSGVCEGILRRARSFMDSATHDVANSKLRGSAPSPTNGKIEGELARPLLGQTLI